MTSQTHVSERQGSLQPAVDLLAEDSLKTELENIISCLPAKEGEVLRLFFGLGGQQPMTFNEIGKQLGCTPEQIGRLKVKALHRLKHNGRCKALKEYLN